MRELNRRTISTVLLLLLCVSIFYTLSSTAAAQPNAAPTTYEKISPDTTISGTIGGQNQEDYYAITLAPGCYNFTLQSYGAQLTFALYHVVWGGMQYVSLTKSTSGNYTWALDTFYPSIDVQSYYISQLAQYCGLYFVSPPASNYVITVYYPGGTPPFPLPLDYNLTVTTAVEVKDIVSGAVEMNNLLELQTGIAHFNCSKTDIYCVNVTWTDIMDSVGLTITDKRGLVLQQMSPHSSGNVGERTYLIMNKTIGDYYISAYIPVFGDTGTVGTNVTIDVTALNAMELTSGGTLTGTNATFSNPINNPNDRLFQFYILEFKQGYMYNITLNVPAGADYTLEILSPSFSLGVSWLYTNAIYGFAGGDGVPENISFFTAAVGYYGGLVWSGPDQSQMFSSGSPPLPVPYTYLVMVRNDSSSGPTGNFTLRSTPIGVPTYNATTDSSLSLTYPQFGMFKVLTKPGYEYEITWKYNASADLKWPLGPTMWPMMMVSVPLPMLPMAYMILKGVVPDYASIPVYSSPLVKAAGLQNATFRADVCSTVLGGFSVTVLPGVGPGAPPEKRLTNMTLVITEKAATALTLNTAASGSLTSGEGELYKIHLVHGTYKLSVNSTTSTLTPTILDNNYNYVLAQGAPSSFTLPTLNNYYNFNVPEEADYYIWLPASSETSYSVAVQPIVLAGLWEFLFPVLIGLAIGFVVGAGILFLIKRK